MGLFRFKRFGVDDSHSAMKIGTDGVILGAWANADGSGSIVDIGAGTGLIALMMAQRFDHAPVIAIEVDPEACKDARDNTRVSPWSQRVEIVESDVFEWKPKSLRHPICFVSNPPFYTEAVRSPDGRRSLARHGDGLSVESLIALCSPLMTDRDDSLTFIAPVSGEAETDFALALHRLTPVRITDVVSMQGRPPIRRLYEVRRENSGEISPCNNTTLVIRDGDGHYTADYISLTNQFYLDTTFNR